MSAFADLVRRGRAASGCLDLAITVDTIEPGRIHDFERWRSVEDLNAWRAVARAPDVGSAILADHVALFDVVDERSPFP